MMTHRLISLLAAVLCATSAGYALATPDPSSLEKLVIQEGGRKKPYLVFAEESLRSLSGKSALTLDGSTVDALNVITGLWMAPSEMWKDKPLILLSNRPLKEHLGLDPKRKLFSYNELTANQELLKEITSAAETRRRDPRAKLAGLQKEASDIGMRLGLFESLLNGDAYRIIPPATGTDWLTVPDLKGLIIKNSFEPSQAGLLHTGQQQIDLSNGQTLIVLDDALVKYWTDNNSPGFNAASGEFIKRQQTLAGLPPAWKIMLEVIYQKAHPFRWAWILYASAAIALLLSRVSCEKQGYLLAWLLAGSGFLLQAAGLASRVLIAGRPPVTNMYESVIWVAFGTIFFALVFETIYRARFFLLGAVPVAVASLILADSQPMILDRSIHPLTPVLRDNFWLTTHVLTITLSYAAFALSLGVAHVALTKVIIGRHPSAALYNYLYKTLQVGVLLLATGTILGGVWANYSWGRFWDWDPKETWALTALLGYLFLLHGRLTGLWGGFGLAIGSVIAFQSVLMAWYGVNFVLGAGLHSYGFGTGGFPLVATFVGCEILFLLAAFLRRKKNLQSKSL